MPLIGFRRNIYLTWLEETAAMVCAGNDLAAIRAAMDERIQPQIQSDVNRRQTVDILCNIWVKSQDEWPALHDEAAQLFQRFPGHDDHVALHYGLTCVMYPFFRQSAEVIGQTLRFGDPVLTATLQTRMPAAIGGFGALHDACKRVIFSLRDWGLLVDGERRHEYVGRRPPPHVSDPDVEAWLLAAILRAHPAESMPFGDLIRLPELFAFEATLTAYQLRESRLFEVYRSGGGWDTVQLNVRA